LCATNTSSIRPDKTSLANPWFRHGMMSYELLCSGRQKPQDALFYSAIDSQVTLSDALIKKHDIAKIRSVLVFARLGTKLTP
jgi:hypothetical protein